jgi:UDP-3-O-[3-hydroxymyristoyl] glucosamine N-acyltransferase
MQFSLRQLAAELGARLRGDGNVRISALATLQRAGEGDLSFLASPRYRKYLASTNASAVILAEADAPAAPVAVLVSDNPYLCYARAAQLLYPQPRIRPGIHPGAVIDGTAQIAPGAQIAAHCVIGPGVRIATDTMIGPGCVIGDGVHIGAGSRLVARVTVLGQAHIGERVIIHPGAVIGADGFGLARDRQRWEKIPQVGSVRVGDDVEIGANTTIDRGALDDTVIGAGVKIDNQVQVGHNVRIGAHTAIAGCVGISGSAVIGSHCTLAGGVGIVGHLEITDHVHVTGMSMVTHSILRPGTYSAGTPLMDNRGWKRNAVRFKQLDDLARRISEVEKDKENN